MKVLLLMLLFSSSLYSQITLTFVGDTTLGQDSRFTGKTFEWQYKQVNNPAWFTDKIRSILQRDNLTIANLEGVILDEPLEPYHKEFMFSGRLEYLNILREGSIELVNLANNHTPYDFGTNGYNQTRRNLGASGIGYYGYRDVFKTQISGKKICICGLEGFRPKVYKQISKTIDQLRLSCDILIYTFHWGVERTYEPNEFQVNLAHYVIDHGADLVIGHHPHVVQTIEHYKGKPIVYSLGNFIFGGNNKPKDMNAIMYQIVYDESLNYKEKVINIKVSSEEDRNNFQPMVR